MKSTKPPSAPTDPNLDVDWQPWEECVEHLHEAAREPIGPEQFYLQLLQGAVDALAALGGAVWHRSFGGELELITQINFKDQFKAHEVASGEAYRIMGQFVANTTHASIYVPAGEQTDQGERLPGDAQAVFGNPPLKNPPLKNPSSAALLLSPVYLPIDESSSVTHPRKHQSSRFAQAIMVLFQRPNITPSTQQFGLQFLSTLGLAAADFEAFCRLRNLTVRQVRVRQTVGLLQQLCGASDLKNAAYWIANEGRRILDCDRMSVLVPRSRGWHLLAVSGADPIQTRADLARQLCLLAERTARWGEVVDYSESGESHWLEKSDTCSNDRGQLPVELGEILQQHIDQAHARRLVAVPLRQEVSPHDALAPQDTSGSRLSDRPDLLPTAVFVVEQFSLHGPKHGSEETYPLRQAVVDLSTLCEPAMRRALNWDRLPVQAGIWLTRWSARMTTWLGLRWAGVVLAGFLALVAALVWIPADFDVAATAQLMPCTSSDLFAPCDGTVQKVFVAHGDVVAVGDVLAELDDPQLALDSQRVYGEIQTVRKQLDVVTATQTERATRAQIDQLPGGRSSTPLSSQEQQLTGRLNGLRKQLQILDRRREALTLRSPIAGQILTLDVHNLLETRPVGRGQVLFTVANIQSGWMLEAQLPQDRLGHVLRAMEASETELPVRFRLAGDRGKVGTGYLEQISFTTVLPGADLNRDAAPIGVRIRVEEETLPYGRAGMTAEVRIGCGRRALGYVWLHDVWETVYRWSVF